MSWILIHKPKIADPIAVIPVRSQQNLSQTMYICMTIYIYVYVYVYMYKFRYIPLYPMTFHYIGGFLKWGYPKMVFMEKPIKNG